MENPWLNIPLNDYEGHMDMPSVGQADMLAAGCANLVKTCRPVSAAILGCAGGNGFEQAVSGGVKRLVGVDINPAYIADAEIRYRDRIENLELYCADLSGHMPPIVPVDLVYGALVFEYVDIARALQNIKALCLPNGVFASLLQLPAEGKASVTPSPFNSLLTLGSIMQLVPPDEFQSAAEAAGFGFVSRKVISLDTGKQFCLQIFRLR